MTSILDLSGIPDKKGNGYELERGEAVEACVIKWFQDNGKEVGLYAFKPYQPELKKSMLTARQMDAVIQMSPSTYQRLEVKGRSGKVWRYKEILVGDVDKWDVKFPEVGILVVVEEETGDARFCQADRETISQHWRKTSRGYQVPREHFKPLQTLVDAYEATKNKREQLERELREVQRKALAAA